MREPTGQTAIQLGRPGSIDHVVDDLQSKGLALLTGISGRADVLAFGRAIAAVRTHRDGSPDGVTTIAQRASAADTVGMGGFSARGLIPHTDGSALPESPRLLIMACLRPAVEGGDSVLIDGYQVYQAIAGTDPQMLDALCARDSVHFGTGAGYLGSIFQPLPGGVSLSGSGSTTSRASPQRSAVTSTGFVDFWRDMRGGGGCMRVTDTCS
jgi:hypothetical protein